VPVVEEAGVSGPQLVRRADQRFGAEDPEPSPDRPEEALRVRIKGGLEEAKGQNVLLYGIGLGDVRKSVLKEFSETTGGRAFFVGKASELAEVYRKIAEELRRQYYLSYATTNNKWDGRFIKLEVKSDNPDWTVRARRGYFAVRAAIGTAPPK